MERHSACPRLAAWSVVEQGALADELQTVRRDGPIRRMHADWQSMRDGIRACQAKGG